MGQEDLNERAKVDLVINGCDNKDEKEVVSGALKKSDSWVRFLITLERLYPTYVTDLELIQEIERIPRLKEYPTTADIAQYVQTLTSLTDQLATSYYDDSEALLHLLPRVPPKALDEIRANPERLSRIHTFNSLVDLLYELALQRTSDATLKNLHSMAQVKWLDRNANANANANTDQAEAFAHSLCDEFFVAFQQARRQGQGNGNPGGGGRGRGGGGRGKGQGQGQWYWRRQVEEDNSQTPKFFATVFCPNCGTKHNVKDKAWQESLDARIEDQKNTKKGQGQGGKDQAKGGSKGEEKGSGGKATGGKANEGKGGKGKGDDKKPPKKKRLEELSEGRREKKRKSLQACKTSEQPRGLCCGRDSGGSLGGHRDALRYCYLLRVAINGVWVDAHLDTGATISLVSSRFVHFEDLVPINICGVKTGEGGVTLTEGEIQREAQVEDRKVLQKIQAFDTIAFEAVLETDFFAQNEWMKYLSLQEPTHLLVVNEEQEWEAIPLKETKCPRPTLKTLKSFPLALDSEVKQESILATLDLHRTENYTLNSADKRDAFRQPGLTPNTCNGDFVELFASKENADAEYFCTPRTNNTWWYDWGKLGAWKMLYAKPPFSKILHTLVKVDMDQATVALVISEGKKWEEKEKLWGLLLERLTVTKLLLPDVPLYQPNPKEKFFQSPVGEPLCT